MVEDILAITGESKVNRVIDVEFGANLSRVLEVIAVNGIIATYSSTQVIEPKIPFFQMMYLDLTLRLVIVYAMPEKAKIAAIEDISAALTEGWMTHRVTATYPLEEVAAAHVLIESGSTRGCVVVDLA